MYGEEMKIWLFDLAHGNLKKEEILKGFIKYYALNDLSIGDVKRDIAFHTTYGEEGIKTAIKDLRAALESVEEQTRDQKQEQYTFLKDFVKMQDLDNEIEI